MDYIDSKTLQKLYSLYHHPAMFLADPKTFSVYADNVTGGDNETDAGDEQEPIDPTLLTVFNILIILQVSFLMITVGTGVTFDGILEILKRPKALIIGLVCQLLLVPMVCFALAHAMLLTNPLAIGMVVVASCPGGAPSSLFTMLSGGDVALSVCMTLFSSILVMGTMPLNVFLYVRSWAAEQVTVTPYLNILIGVVFTWAPCLVGILLRRRFPKRAPLLTKAGGLFAFCVLVAFFLLNRVLFPGVFSLRWGVWYTALTVPFIAWLVAYGISMVFLVEREQRKAIAFGSSLVNGGLSIALISLTYDGVNDVEEMLQFPMLYMGLQILDAIIVTIMTRVLICAREQRTICQKLHQKRKRKSSLTTEEAHKEENGVANNAFDAGKTDTQQPIDRSSTTGFYIPRSPTELVLEDSMARDRAFSV